LYFLAQDWLNPPERAEGTFPMRWVENYVGVLIAGTNGKRRKGVRGTADISPSDENSRGGGGKRGNVGGDEMNTLGVKRRVPELRRRSWRKGIGGEGGHFSGHQRLIGDRGSRKKSAHLEDPKSVGKKKVSLDQCEIREGGRFTERDVPRASHRGKKERKFSNNVNEKIEQCPDDSDRVVT